MTPREIALQRLAEMLDAAVAASGRGQLVAVLFVAVPANEYLGEREAAELEANKGFAIAFDPADPGPAVGIESGTPDLD